MASYQKFHQFVEDLGDGVHDLSSDTLKVALTNVAPTSSLATFSQITEIADVNGYTAGGKDTSNNYTETSGTGTCSSAASVTWTATGNMAEFRYVVLYNDTPTSPADPLIAWWDHGSAVNLTSGDTFTVNFGSSTLFTIT
jgi:hypothetical protein